MVDHDSGKRKGDFGDSFWRDFRSRWAFHCLFWWDVANKTFAVFLFYDLFIVLLVFQCIYVFYDLSIYLFICVFYVIYLLFFVLFLIYLLTYIAYTRKSKWQFARILRTPFVSGLLAIYLLNPYVRGHCEKWYQEMGVEYVIESTGLFVEAEKVRLGLVIPNREEGPASSTLGKDAGNGISMRLESKEARFWKPDCWNTIP